MVLIRVVDPEFKAELAERQKESASRTQSNPVQSFDAAGWLAGTSSTKAASPPAVVEKVEKGGRGGRR